MKIGLVCPYDIFKNGGVQEVVLELQKRLKKRGHKAVIVTPRPPGYTKPNPADIRLVGRSRSIRALSTTAQVSLSFEPKQLNALLKNEDFDIINFHEPWVPILSKQILDKTLCPVVATFHAKLPPGPLLKLFKLIITPYTKSIIKKFKYLSAVSPSAAEYAASLTKQAIAIIPNGIDLTKYRTPHSALPTPHSKSAMRILYIGRLEKRKGVEHLIKAFRLAVVENPNLKLLIAGDGNLRSQLEKQANSLPEGSVEFLGYISDTKKIQLLKTCRLFCSPALYGESFGIVLIEAMAAHAVAMGGNNPGYQNVLTGNGATTLFNPKDTTKFTKKLLELTSNETMRKKWLIWSKKEVPQYDYEKVVDKYEALFRKAIAK